MFATDGGWWDRSLAECGMQIIDRSISPDADWEEVLRSGREELLAACRVSKMSLDPARRVLEIGCGVGRVAFALADYFCEVVGADISQSMLNVAKAHNTRSNLRFEVVSRSRLEPDRRDQYDTIFANEVFHYLDWETLSNYVEDAYRLLRVNGEFVFQINQEPITWRTRISWMMRAFLHRIGAKKWRAWSTSTPLIRFEHPRSRIRQLLEKSGFVDLRIETGKSVRQTWIISRKPAVSIR